MKHLTKTDPSRKYLLLAFLFPFLGYTMVMLISRYTPFGPYSILYSDMYHQYYPFFVEFRDTLRSGESLLYNWNLGMGLDYLALGAYYLASPLNLLSVIVPEGWLLGYFSMLVPIKLGFAGLFFGIFLKRIFQRCDLGTSLFSACYGLCAWALGYQWNIMWLDTFALLPLVILGMVNLLQRRRFALYTLSLFLAVLANYYIGFFVCIFVGLCFVVFEICCWQGIRKFLADLGLMAVFSVLAIAMTAFLELPAFIALGNTYSSINKFPTSFSLNIAHKNTWMGLLDAMRQVAGNTAGGVTPTYKEGLPNLYCGILPILFLFQFMASGKIKLRQKLCTAFLLLFFMVSFIIRQLDYIWHGFHFTNMIPYRFSFLFSFVVLVAAYQAYLHRERCPKWGIVLSGILFLGVAACANSRFDLIFLLFNLIFLVIYLTLQLCEKRPRRETVEDETGITVQIIPLDDNGKRYNRNVSLILLGTLALELICSLIQFGISFTGTSVTNYPRGLDDSKHVIQYMHALEDDTVYYRAEATHTQTLNDDALNGYSGITLFSSSANVRVTKFMAALGFGAKPSYNRYSFEESSPVSNLFLNLKYLICRDGKLLDSSVYHSVCNMGEVYLLENDAYLPLGFMVADDIIDISSEARNAGSFDFQNKLFSAATGLDWAVYSKISNYKTTGVEGVKVIKTGSYGDCTYSADVSGTATVSFQVPKDGFVCLDVSASKRNSLTVYKNSTSICDEKISLDQMIAVGSCKAGDLIEITFDCKKNEDGRIGLTAAVLNEDVFWEGYELLSRSVLQLEECSGTKVSGTVHAPENASILYTSIPFTNNWTAEVDGQPAEVIAVCDSMVGLKLSPGSHTVTFRYINTAFHQGILISVCASVVFAGLILFTHLPRRKENLSK